MYQTENEVLEISQSQIALTENGDLQLLLIDNNGQVVTKLDNEGDLLVLPVSYTYTNPPWKS